MFRLINLTNLDEVDTNHTAFCVTSVFNPIPFNPMRVPFRIELLNIPQTRKLRFAQHPTIKFMHKNVYVCVLR